ncbi:MAG TPA: S9 family peptidase [Sphingomicrobium sp.]|nr:S9 family peptidase [Sphingomicrobium sp.]
MMRSILIAAAAAALTLPVVAEARPMTATDMHMMRRLGAPEVSSDGRWAVFTLSDTDLAQNRRNNRLHLLDLTARGAVPQPIAALADKNARDPVFGPDGALYFILDNEVWRMPIGGAPQQISNFEGEIGGFKLAGDRLVVWADRDLRCRDLGCRDVPKAEPRGTGRAYDQLFVRHWDAWRDPAVRSRLFGFTLQGGRVAGVGVPLTGSLVGDVPVRPFGGGDDIVLSPDGRTVYFVLREAGRIEPTSTNLDIFAAPTDGSTPPVNLTADNPATDTHPAVSPDGRTLAYVAMRRAGYESDRQVIHLRDLATGRVRALAENWDRSVGGIAWARDGRSLIAEAGERLDNPLFRIDVASGRVTRLTGDGTAHFAKPLPGGGLLYALNSVHAPDDLYRLDSRGRSQRLTSVNAGRLAELDPVRFDRFRFAGAGGAEVWGIKVKPARGSAPLPVAFIVHGGPQGSFGNSWSYRWNSRLFASPGYGVVSIDFHGSTGHGQAFTDAINRDWGGKPLQDLQLGLEHAVRTDPQLDGRRACALGASYGGYMMYWIAGNWPDRFNCLVSHNGVFDTRSMGYMTEELWFTEWEFGGTPWDVPQEYERWNPINHVAKWRTPTLVIISDRDYRVPYTQGLGAFTALQRRGIPSRLLRFPDENHWVLKPNNSIQWYDEVFAWMDRHTAGRGSDGSLP